MIKTNATYEKADTQTNKIFATEEPHWNGQWIITWGLVLLVRNLTLNSDADLNYKYMFDPHKDPLRTHL